MCLTDMECFTRLWHINNIYIYIGTPSSCDMILRELQRRFETKYILFVLSIEQTLVKAANKKDFQGQLKNIGESVYNNEADVSDLNVKFFSVVTLFW